MLDLIVEICKKLNQKNFLSSADGNISFKESDDRIYITPSGVNKSFITKDDIAIINIQNEIIKGSPSSESLMHLEVYKNCPKAKAVVHAHPPTAIAWTIAKPELNEIPIECMSEVILSVGVIPIVPYARPGTEDLAVNLKPYLPKNRVMILSRHGVLSWGEDLIEAYNGVERIEHSCEILWRAQTLGGCTSLPKEEIDYLKEKRKLLGEKIL
jgi:L-fuculose-phosphate aldolase